jgi:hypothetical protein
MGQEQSVALDLSSLSRESRLSIPSGDCDSRTQYSNNKGRQRRSTTWPLSSAVSHRTIYLRTIGFNLCRIEKVALRAPRSVRDESQGDIATRSIKLRLGAMSVLLIASGVSYGGWITSKLAVARRRRCHGDQTFNEFGETFHSHLWP